MLSEDVVVTHMELSFVLFADIEPCLEGMCMLILEACLWTVCQAEGIPPLLRLGAALIRREEEVLTENIHRNVVQYQDL